MTNEELTKIKENILQERKIANELNSLSNFMGNSDSEQEKKMIENQMGKLKSSMKGINDELLKNIEEASISAPLTRSIKTETIAPKEIQKKENKSAKSTTQKESLSDFDKEILKRMKKEQQKKVEIKEKKTSDYAKIANKLFSNFSMSAIKRGNFKKIGRDLIQANLDSSFVSYVSRIFLSTAIAFGIGLFLFVFLMFFNVSSAVPIISRVTESLGIRFLKIFWIPIVIPLGTFAFMYLYPSMEKKSLGSKIDAELPFAAIHMAAISGSMIDPTKIFSIISSTKEYPNLEKEFNKLINEINVYGYDLVTALKDLALNTSSAKLSELLNGLATTITSGGSLYEFFEKRSQSLLFEYRLDKEKQTKSAETFMDIYISVVIAAPMILMLLLIMMKISGLGISLSTSTITLLVVGGVTLINIFFLAFLQVKQQSTG